MNLIFLLAVAVVLSCFALVAAFGIGILIGAALAAAPEKQLASPRHEFGDLTARTTFPRGADDAAGYRPDAPAGGGELRHQSPVVPRAKRCRLCDGLRSLFAQKKVTP